MSSGLDSTDPLIVAAFRAALLHQGLIALLIIVVAGAIWIGWRFWHPRPALDGTAAGLPGAGLIAVEPTGRRVLRIGFGLLWLFDGILQAQPNMPLGLLPQGIEPTALSSTPWVRDAVNWAGTAWTYHPVQASAAAVWIQIGLGIWLLTAPHGIFSRLAGLASVGWGLAVWVFGESFGGIFAPALTWLTGAPGAAIIYVAAGALIALPERQWLTPRLGRLTLGGLGVFLGVMAGLQARPGTGFWQGGAAGTLAVMQQSMAQTPQPHFLSGWVSAFGAFDEVHAVAVNLFVVVALTVIALAFLSGRRRLIRPALGAFIVLCLADWVLVQDLGFLGGVGTDPNSMIPLILLATGGYLALTQAEAAPAPRPARIRWMSVRWVAAVGAAGLMTLGTVLILTTRASQNADPILAESVAGSPAHLDYPAPGFTLTSQYGQTVTLADLRGKVLLLSFINPGCVPVTCPPLGQEFRQATRMLGGHSGQVVLAGIVLSPAVRPASALQTFDRQNGLDRVPGWLYLTGTPAQLNQVRQEYGTTSQDEIYLIDPAGHVRQKYSPGTGPVSAALNSSFAVLFADSARQALTSKT